MSEFIKTFLDNDRSLDVKVKAFNRISHNKGINLDEKLLDYFTQTNKKIDKENVSSVISAINQINYTNQQHNSKFPLTPENINKVITIHKGNQQKHEPNTVQQPQPQKRTGTTIKKLFQNAPQRPQSAPQVQPAQRPKSAPQMNNDNEGTPRNAQEKLIKVEKQNNQNQAITVQEIENTYRNASFWNRLNLFTGKVVFEQSGNDVTMSKGWSLNCCGQNNLTPQDIPQIFSQDSSNYKTSVDNGRIKISSKVATR